MALFGSPSLTLKGDEINMPRANRLCSEPSCLNRPVANGRCQSHPFERYQDPWSRETPYSGNISSADKSRVMYEEPGCASCGVATEPLQIDHIIPVHLGGSDERVNLQRLCIPCHTAKTSKEALQAKINKRSASDRA